MNKITRICRKANENEDFQLLLQCLKQYNEHPKIFFKKPVTLQNIPGDDDCFDTNEDVKLNI